MPDCHLRGRDVFTAGPSAELNQRIKKKKKNVTQDTYPKGFMWKSTGVTNKKMKYKQQYEGFLEHIIVDHLNQRLPNSFNHNSQ